MYLRHHFSNDLILALDLRLQALDLHPFFSSGEHGSGAIADGGLEIGREGQLLAGVMILHPNGEQAYQVVSLQVLCRLYSLLVKVIFHDIVERAGVASSSSAHVLLQQGVESITGEFSDLQEGATVLQGCEVHGHVRLHDLRPAKLVSVAELKQGHIGS